MVDGTEEVQVTHLASLSPTKDMIGTEGDADIEPRNGIEFESHVAAYSFYQDYAKSMGFTTSIKNSRRSKKSKEFIDAKFACSRYGVTPESDSSNGRRPSVKKTDCKASMHVKRRPDGKWVIHNFIKEHNHELLPALAYHFRIHRNVKLAEKNNIDILHAVSERTRKMYVEMSRQTGGCQNFGFVKNETRYQFDKGKHLALEEGDALVILEYFKHIQTENPNFFYAIDLNEEQCLRNLFWVDAKSRNDYVSFSDVVSFDMAYVKGNDKMPFAPFIGVNHHYQSMLLGCALIADETRSAFVWLMKTWLRAMGGRAPKAIITDQNRALKAAVEEVLPNVHHYYSLWSILERIPETLAHILKQHEKFMDKFNKCIFKSWTEEQFEMRWWKIVSRFELQDDEWVRSLYDDRKMWVPTFMFDTLLAGMSTTQRSESVNAFFDKYIHKKITLKDFIKQYGTILQNRYEEEVVADFDTWHKQPALKSPSPWEKQMSTIYTHAIFKKFQVEVLGVVGCHPKKESEDGTKVIFRVVDCEKGEDFMVSWDESKLQISCLCRSFEYNGFLCRHAMIVLQIQGFTSIPSHYILTRWTKDAKSKQSMWGERIRSRVQRYNELCKRAIELGEEGSLSQERYNIAVRTLDDALKNCVNDNLTSDGITLNGCYNTNQNMQGLVQLNLMEPPHDGYYVGQAGIQGLGQLNSMAPTHDGQGQLNSIAPNHDGFFGTQQSMHGLGHLDFRPPATFGYNMQDESSLRSAQLHADASRHP
ncbi:MULE transposase domain [Dillenia turbinata]|uniref:Protein FAR1-RELATED SEQUENCE n=1 Tax=Dillenia turbinata TaxID=194707 RepID=A0AAN8YZL9_9MAGN